MAAAPPLRRIFSLGMGPARPVHPTAATPRRRPPTRGSSMGRPWPPGEEPPGVCPRGGRTDGVDPDAPPPPTRADRGREGAGECARLGDLPPPGLTARGSRIFLDGRDASARPGSASPRRDVAEIFEEPYVEVSGFEPRLSPRPAALPATATGRGDLRAVSRSAAQGERHGNCPPVPVVLRGTRRGPTRSPPRVATATGRGPSFLRPRRPARVPRSSPTS